MDLSNLKPAAGSKHDNKRIGRGHASGTGKTAGKGHKGQKARSGGGSRPGFEGGQMPLYRRIPKRGFKNINHKEFATFNVSALDVFDDGATVEIADLLEKRIVRKELDGVKALGNGEITKKLTVKVNAFSKTAQEKIEKAGGSAEVV